MKIKILSFSLIFIFFFSTNFPSKDERPSTKVIVSSLVNAQSKANELAPEIERLSKEVERLKELVEKLQNEITEKNTEIQNLKTETKENDEKVGEVEKLEERVKKLQNEITKKNSEIIDLNEKFSVVQNENSLLRGQNSNVEKLLSELEFQYGENISLKLEQLNKKFVNLKFNDLEKNLNDLFSNFKNLQKNVKELLEKFEASKGNVNFVKTLEQENTKLKDTLKSNLKYQEDLKKSSYETINNLKEKFKITGDRVSQLGLKEREYKKIEEENERYKTATKSTTDDISSLNSQLEDALKTFNETLSNFENLQNTFSQVNEKYKKLEGSKNLEITNLKTKLQEEQEKNQVLEKEKNDLLQQNVNLEKQNGVLQGELYEFETLFKRVDRAAVAGVTRNIKKAITELEEHSHDIPNRPEGDSNSGRFVRSHLFPAPPASPPVHTGFNTAP